MESRLLTGREVARKLNISKSFAFLLMQRGEIPTVHLGRLVRVRQEDLEQFIEQSIEKKPHLMLK
jgi:excisionase family DNA binding protein